MVSCGTLSFFVFVCIYIYIFYIENNYYYVIRFFFVPNEITGRITICYYIVIKTTKFKYTNRILGNMITDNETLKKIKSLGLNTYEAKIWTALLSRGSSTAGELSDIANVPRSRSYDVLESLEKKGFVVMKLGKPIKYSAVAPKDVLEKVKKQIEKKTENHISKIMGTSFVNLIGNLQTMHESSTLHIENVVAVLRGWENIQKHLEFLFKNAKNEISISVEKETGKFLKILGNIRNKTKNIKITITSNRKDIPQREEFDLKIKDVGVRMCIIDEDNVVIFPVSEQDTHPDYDLGVWVKNKQTTRLLKQLLSSA